MNLSLNFKMLNAAKLNAESELNCADAVLSKRILDVTIRSFDFDDQ